ncbi:MAG: Flp pilus assembly complex ATPase component TadA [Candidatus Gastranaerophilales bacterium]|nr:Flp pilus assembly complex ATPase component TadA [Candidatus Gastranaerophilales bacterium]
MDNSIIKKLINKINLDIAQKFELSVAKELSFVPVNIQNDIFFVAIYSNSNKEKIKQYINSIVACRVEFIYLTKENFELLFSSFLHKFPSDSPVSVQESDIQSYKAEPEIQEMQAPDDDYTDLNITDDEEDVTFLDDGDEEDLFSQDEETSEGISISSDDSDMSDDGVIEIEGEDIADSSVVTFSDSDEDSDMEFDIDLDADFELEPPPIPTEPVGLDGRASADISKVKAPETKKLGEILLEEKLISDKQLQIALAESKAQGIPLGSILVKLGFVKIKDLKEALGAQMGLEYATAEQLKVLPTAISILPEDFVKINKVIPLSLTDKTLVVGMVNPGDKKVIDEIVYQTGLNPTIKLVTHVEFENYINMYYSADKADTENLLQKINEDDEIEQNQGELWQQVEKEIQGSDGAVSQLANKIITMAIDRRASDIHIEPMSAGYRVRIRVDGSLHNAIKIPQKVDSAVISRFKVLSKMNIAEHRRAQDGSFTLKYKNRAQDFRVNTLPVAGREKMVIRILAPQMDSVQAKADTIEIAGAHEDDIKKIRYLVSSPNGIVLTSGPTGSGKTTTLYAILRYLNSDSVNITTIEDPVEIKLEGINQSAVNPKAGITFANSLRAILRQDPDTILIGEIRDYETLEVAISASLTGHLVLSTVHTNSAAATITRLIEMGAKDYLISSTISGIIAQRLVKKLCPNCKEEYYPSEEEARKILSDPVEVQKLTQTKIYRPKGCPNCKNTGYLGRLAVLEILVVNNELRKMIAQRAHDVELEDFAVKQGMNTLKMSCLRHILEGNTSIDEQVRILGLASE